MVLMGLEAKEKMERRWGEQQRLAGYFGDVVRGMTVLKSFNRSRDAVDNLDEVGAALRATTMSTLRVAFLSSFALELLSSLATALVALVLGIRLLNGSISLTTGLVVLLLAPEVFLPLRRAAARFHASADGVAAATSVLAFLEGSRDPGSRAAPTSPPVIELVALGVGHETREGSTRRVGRGRARGRPRDDRRAVGVGQVDAPADPGRSSRPERGVRARRRRRPGRPGPGRLARGRRVAAPGPDAAGRHRARRGPAGRTRHSPTTRSARRWPRSGWTWTWTAPSARVRRSSRRASCAGSRSFGACCAGRWSCCSTSPPPTWTRRAPGSSPRPSLDARRRASWPRTGPSRPTCASTWSHWWVTVLLDGAPWCAPPWRREKRAIARALAAGLLVTLSTVGLAGTSAWLIVRAAQRPSVLSLTVPMGLVQLFALAKAAGRYVERTQTHRAALGVMGHVRATVAALLEPLVPAGLGPRSAEVVDLVLRDVDRVQDLLTAVAGPLVTSVAAGLVTASVSRARGAVDRAGAARGARPLGGRAAGARGAVGRGQRGGDRRRASADGGAVRRGGAQRRGVRDEPARPTSSPGVWATSSGAWTTRGPGTR